MKLEQFFHEIQSLDLGLLTAYNSQTDNRFSHLCFQHLSLTGALSLISHKPTHKSFFGHIDEWKLFKLIKIMDIYMAQ